MADKTTPARFFKELKKSSPEERKFEQEIRKARDEGVDDGRREMRVEVLTYLEEKYLNPEVDRHGTEGKAIISLATELAKHFEN